MSDDKHDRVRVRGRNVQYKDTLSFHGKELINIPRSIVIKLRDGIKTFAERGGGGGRAAAVAVLFIILQIY